MDTKIFQNSYIIFVISFIILYILFYLTGVGYTIDMSTGKPVKKTSWKYPLGLSLIIWVFWHYYLYPVGDDPDLFRTKGGNSDMQKIPDRYRVPAGPEQFDPKHFTGGHLSQKINMNNWT